MSVNKIGTARFNRRLTKAAADAGTTLTKANRQFYINLVRAARLNGTDDEDGNLVITKSVTELAQMTRTPCRTAIQSLQRLSRSGVIERHNAKTFPIMPSATVIVKEYMEGAIDDD